MDIKPTREASDAFKKQVPGVQIFTEDRDRLIRFYANGAVAIASPLITPSDDSQFSVYRLPLNRPTAFWGPDHPARLSCDKRQPAATRSSRSLNLLP